MLNEDPGILFKHFNGCVFLADNELQFLDMHVAAGTILDYSTDELSRFSLYDLIVDEDEKKKIRQLLHGQHKVIDLEIKLYTKLNEKVDCILSLEKNEGMDNKLQGILIDKTKENRNTITALRNEKLKAAERLINTLAHEVRNPLNNINLSVEQLSSELQDENTVTFLDIIQRNSNRINAIIYELLNATKTTETINDNLNLQAQLEKTIALVRNEMIQKNMQLEIDLPKKDVIIKGDEGKLQIALLHILMNAIDAMKPGIGKLSIRLFSEKRIHIIHIRDNGSGITIEHLDKLFEPYFTTKRNRMGLGLPYTLNIIQSHKGTLDVDSSQKNGTVFILSFHSIEK